MSEWRLRPHRHWAPCPGPVVTVVMDGVGIGRRDQGDAVWLARTPTLDRLEQGSWLPLIAHGTAMGLPSDSDMGNSEVGHNVLGAGRTFDQGALLVENAIESRRMFEGEAWRWIVGPPAGGTGALHFIGLLSDGNVHSHEDHLHAMLREARSVGCPRVYCHVLLDGRDVHPTSAHTYLQRLEAELALLSGDGFDYRVASGGGRMVTTMDRYEADWSIVERGWHAHVLGDARGFASAREAVETFRAEVPNVGDQRLPEFVVVDSASSEPVGRIQDGDSVVFFNFRGDRALEITRAFVEESFDGFDRVRYPAVRFAGMMQYDGDLALPPRYLVAPPEIAGTMGELLAESGLRQVACAETQKYGHVTYFWNGNRSGRFDPALEDYIEIASDRLPFDERPQMKAAEVTDAVIASLRRSPPPVFLRLNY
ncbi:MAG: phosphoglycerate mutase (2,3-diphosphoglycerate-independent), partial [Deltaproteobacteria bacterium]|nr:phosphoglycerate mutase (2,3-diphosphoglycerate-independent) [Deltaproteobacteria bacterium]